MSQRADSLAGRSFDEAERVLHALDFLDPALAPPFELVVPKAPQRSKLDAPARASRPPSGSPPIGLKGPTLLEALEQLSSGALTTSELVEQALSVAASIEELGAVVAVDQEQVRAEAGRLDQERQAGSLRGPLHGIPITVKDIIHVEGLPTKGGSLAWDELPAADAPSVARLRAAGALILAKVATHEFALGVTTPQCRNPHDPSRISGGSSGGSAISVATGVGLASLGTDTRASLRVPAALCGVVGFKPTFGRVPAGGIIPLSWSIDHLGPIARTAGDAAMMLNSLADEPFLDPMPAPRPGVIGVATEVFEDADELVGLACESALSLLERSGWKLVELPGPTIAELELSNALGLLISRSEAAAFHRAAGTDLDRCIPEVREQLLAGLTISAADYLDAQRQRRLLCATVLERFVDCDVVASPTSPIVAPPHRDYERYLLRLSRNTIIWSLLGAPAASLPCGTGEEGLPVGLQLAAPPRDEQRLVDAGIALELALGSRP